MMRVALSRIAQALIVMWMVATAVFFIFRALPGDPASMTLGLGATPEAIRAVRTSMGLDRPFVVQYADWLSGLLTFDLGVAYTQGGIAVTDLVVPALGRSAELATAAMVIAILLAIPMGTAAARRPGKKTDYLMSALATIGLSVPAYILGIWGLWAFSETLGWLPPGGYVSWTDDLWGFLARIALPAASVGIVIGGRLARFLRVGMVEALSSAYAMLARSKGAGESRVILVHAFRNAAIPFVTEVGLSFGLLIGGMVVVEQVFGWPGMGYLTINAIFQRSFDVVQAAVLISAATLVAANTAVDLLYGVLDPRISVRRM